MSKIQSFLVSFCILFIFTIDIISEDLKVISWNVESSGSKNEVIAEQIENLGKHHLWGLSEVPDNNAALLFKESAEKANPQTSPTPEASLTSLTTTIQLASLEPIKNTPQQKYKAVVGTTGKSDRLVILYDTQRLQKLDHQEIHEINIGGRVRSPLVGKFLDLKTNTKFYFMVNHLYRGNKAARHEQSKMLNQWTAKHAIPVIAVGDYNYDWQVKNGDLDHDAGYDLLTENNTLSWVRPKKLVPTQDSKYNSVLDFIFTSYTMWKAKAKIIVRPNDFPDDNTTSDHRPVRATFSIR